MLDIPQNITVNHKIDAKDVSIKLSLYDAEKKTICGIPIAGLAIAGLCAAAFVVILAKRKKGKKS